MWLLDLIISVMGGHCGYSSGVAKYLATPLPSYTSGCMKKSVLFIYLFNFFLSARLYLLYLTSLSLGQVAQYRMIREHNRKWRKWKLSWANWRYTYPRLCLESSTKPMENVRWEILSPGPTEYENVVCLATCSSVTVCGCMAMRGDRFTGWGRE
jgi:hypothetical protein